jgi:ABC-type multidrug transport system fused ATPase/permease subunit
MNKLTISDWITFLSSEKHGSISSVFEACALLVAFIALILTSTRGNVWEAISGSLLILVFAYYFLVKVLIPLEKRGNPAQKILSRIMKGELNDVNSIQDEWKLATEEKKGEKSNIKRSEDSQNKRSFVMNWKTVLFIVIALISIIGVGVLIAISTKSLANGFIPALTLSLVWVTAYYAFVTAKIMEINDKQANIALEAQFSSAVPIISLRVTPSPYPAVNQIIVTTYNMGKGPALNFRCWIEDSEYPSLKRKDNIVYDTAIPIDTHRNYDIDIPSKEYTLCNGYIRAQYESVFGITYESTLIFPQNTASQLEWVKAKEVLRF